MSDSSALTPSRYPSLEETGSGAFAAGCAEDLLRALVSDWPRRSRTALVMDCGNGRFLETLWDAGLDVTGHESSPELLLHAKTRLGTRADFVFGNPEHLPFDDGSFDYVAAVAALEFWENPAAVLREMNRLACCGAVLVFPSAWSLFRLEYTLGKQSPLCREIGPRLLSPRAVRAMTRQAFDSARLTWATALFGPTATWRADSSFSFLNARCPFLCCGAFTGVRADFGPRYTGTPLFVPSRTPVPAGK